MMHACIESDRIGRMCWATGYGPPDSAGQRYRAHRRRKDLYESKIKGTDDTPHDTCFHPSFHFHGASPSVPFCTTHMTATGVCVFVCTHTTQPHAQTAATRTTQEDDRRTCKSHATFVLVVIFCSFYFCKKVLSHDDSSSRSRTGTIGFPSVFLFTSITCNWAAVCVSGGARTAAATTAHGASVRERRRHYGH
jgi:hypothetical protein